MKLKLATTLSLFFILIGLVSVLSISVIVNSSFEKLFSEYSIQRQEQKNEQVAQALANQFQHESRWDKGMVEDAGIGFLDEGLIIKVADTAGSTVWDAREYNNGICQAMIDKAALDMKSRYPSVNGGLTQKTYTVEWEGRNLGTVEIGYYGPFYYSDVEVLFLGTINNILIGAALGTMILAALAGILVARRISRPLAAVALHTRHIAGGRYSEKIQQGSAIAEVDGLVSSINSLSVELLRQEQSKKDLTLSVAHELRTPLATLQAQIEALLDGVWQPTKKRLRDAHEEILRLTGLVTDLETLARYDSAGISLSLVPLDPKSLVEKACRLFQAKLKAKKISATVTGEPGTIRADADKLLQVFINLFSNSLAYTQPGGRIRIDFRSSERRLLIVFKDTGRGIPAADLPFIFERLYRADKSRSRQTGGSGMGLAIVREIVKAHRGSIKVKSALGKGTEFTISLPR